MMFPYRFSFNQLLFFPKSVKEGFDERLVGRGGLSLQQKRSPSVYRCRGADRDLTLALWTNPLPADCSESNIIKPSMMAPSSPLALLLQMLRSLQMLFGKALSRLHPQPSPPLLLCRCCLVHSFRAFIQTFSPSPALLPMSPVSPPPSMDTPRGGQTIGVAATCLQLGPKKATRPVMRVAWTYERTSALLSETNLENG